LTRRHQTSIGVKRQIPNPVSILFIPSHGFEIQCRFSLTSWSRDAYRTCTLISINVTEYNQTITNIKSTENFTEIAFVITNQNCFYVPRGIGKFYPKLDAFAIGRSKLKSVNKFDLEQFPKLKKLNLDRNNLESLESDLFVFNPDLVHLDIENNPLKQIGENIFATLKNLQTAWFQSSLCVHRKANSPNEIKALIVEMEEECATEEMKKNHCSKDIEILNDLVEKEQNFLDKEISKKQALHRNLNDSETQLKIGIAASVLTFLIVSILALKTLRNSKKKNENDSELERFNL
jgi:hypothetical protein